MEANPLIARRCSHRSASPRSSKSKEKLLQEKVSNRPWSQIEMPDDSLYYIYKNLKEEKYMYSSCTCTIHNNRSAITSQPRSEPCPSPQTHRPFSQTLLDTRWWFFKT